MMKSMTIFVAAAMLAMSAPAFATKDCPPGHEKIGSCVGGEVVPYPGDTINNYNGPTNTGSIAGAVAGAAAGAAVVDSGNATVGNVSATTGPVSATGGNATSTLGTVSGFGNSLLSPEANASANNTNLNTDVNTVTTTNTQGQQQGQQQGQVALGGASSSVSQGGSVSVAEGAIQASQTATGGQGGSINIYGGGQGEGSEATSSTAPFSSNVTVAEGAVQNSNTNTASATGGSVASGAVVNNVTVQQPEGNNGIQIESGGSLGGSQASGNETQVQVDARTFNESKTVIPVASAAPSFSSICSSGAGGQAKDWGFSVAVTNAVCQHLMMADAMMALGDREAAIKHVKKAERHANVKGFFNYFLHVGTLGIL